VSPVQASRVSRAGRFERSVHRFGKRDLRRGVYRVRARYRSSVRVQSAASWSPRFKIRR
jgi:hypothetical protein